MDAVLMHGSKISEAEMAISGEISAVDETELGDDELTGLVHGELGEAVRAASPAGLLLGEPCELVKRESPGGRVGPGRAIREAWLVTRPRAALGQGNW